MGTTIYENGLEAAESVTVRLDGTKDFADTGTDLSFSGISGSGTVTVKEQGKPPNDTAGIGEQNVSKYRVTIDASGDLSFNSVAVRLGVSQFSGTNDPSAVTIYKRDSVGSGTFTALETTVGDNNTSDDVSDDTLYATTDSFSKFVLASDTQPLPVELASFDAQTDDEQVRLAWKTTAETSNTSFRIQRRDAETEGRGD